MLTWRVRGFILVTVDAGAGKYTISYGAASHEFTIGGGTAVTASVSIESLLPNPPGPDNQGEEVVVRNKSAAPVAISGWRLEDGSGLTWPFVGAVTLAGGEAWTIQRNGRAMSLNNSGDEIRLLDAAGITRDQFAYPGSSEGARIQTGH